MNEEELIERLKKEYPDDYYGIIGSRGKITTMIHDILVKQAKYRFE